MKLNSTLALSLLAFAPHAVALKEGGGSNNSSAKHRMLARAEANGAATARDRQLQKKNGRNAGNGGGNGGGAAGGENGKKAGGGGGVMRRPDLGYNGSHSRGKKAALKAKPHSAHLDENNSGMAADAVEYYYGDAISLTFEVTNDLVPYDAQLGLNMDNMDQWRVGLFMRMADPQDGAVPPIVSVAASITDASGGRRIQDKKGVRGRNLQDDGTEEPPVEAADPTMDPDEMADEEVTVPDLNYVGSATFSSADTSPAVLKPLENGNGIDAYLISETGAAIVGPVTFYMLPTADMEAAEAAAAKNKGKSPLKKYNHASTTKGKYGKGGSTAGGAKGGGKKVNGASVPDDVGLGLGSGGGGGQIIGTAEALADYLLEADATYYTLGDEVTIVYDIGEQGRRRLQKFGGITGGGKGKGNGGGVGGGNGNPTTTQATQATTEATSAASDDASTTSATAPATTTTAPDDVDSSTGGAGDDAPMAQPTVDETDITLFKLGVFMRMAHPQGGSLAPIHSIDFCPTSADGEDCGLSADQLESGTFKFNTSDVYDLEEYGSGYDFWILNGVGAGVAGPVSFYIDPKE